MAAEENSEHRRWLTIKQLMQMLSLKQSRIYYLVHTEEIPYYKIGQTLLFREDKIINWMEGNRQ